MPQLQQLKKTQQIGLNPDLPNFRYVREWKDEFLALFPHREDYLWAEYPASGERPQWHTQSSHPLSDRQIQQGEHLFGVRFDAVTNYLMLDVDPDSPYHPTHDPFAISSIVNTLEPLGLVTYVAIRSSSRGGIHLYLPFQESQKSWAIARAAATLLSSRGFNLSPGQLELFPNPKPYSDTPTLYSGHRLPLQQSSYLLSEEWEPIYSTQAEFVRRWKFAQNRNDVSHTTVEQVLKEAQCKAYSKLRNGGQKYLNDLNADIDSGWTAPGQTNFLLGKIANRERVFHHVLCGGEPLEGDGLAKTITQVARSLPGFQDFCGHQGELEQKAKEWARAAEQRYYPYPYGSVQLQQGTKQEEGNPELSWNQKQAQEARERIRRAIADLLNQELLPTQPTARQNAIRAYGIGNKTLDKNRDLWHPDHLKPLPEAQYHPVETELLQSNKPEPLLEAQYHPSDPNKLVGLVASDVPQEQSEVSPTNDDGGCGGFSTGRLPRGVEWIQLALLQIQTRKNQAEVSQTETTSDLVPETSLNSESPAYSPVEKSGQIDKAAKPRRKDPSVSQQRSNEDTSDLVAAIQVQTKLLKWTSEETKRHIANCFNGRARAELNSDELFILLSQLKEANQPEPIFGENICNIEQPYLR